MKSQMIISARHKIRKRSKRYHSSLPEYFQLFFFSSFPLTISVIEKTFIKDHFTNTFLYKNKLHKTRMLE